MRVIIAGSRTITDYKIVRRAISKCFWRNEIKEIVSGTAKGVDKLGELYANKYGLPIKRFPANWDMYGKSAGYIRNAAMMEYADGLIAIWDGQSKGTKNMLQIMRKSDKPVFVCLDYWDYKEK